MGDVMISTSLGGMPGYLSRSGGDGPWPGVVVLHDGFGIGQAVRLGRGWPASQAVTAGSA
jgi:dienelactone hydrolase